jgi:hypothetical protein
MSTYTFDIDKPKVEWTFCMSSANIEHGHQDKDEFDPKMKIEGLN